MSRSSNISLSDPKPSHIHGLYVSNPRPCSSPRLVRASLALLHHVLRRSILSLPSRCTLAQCRLNPPLLVHPWHRPSGHETHSPAPWQSNLGSTVSSAPGFARSGTPYYFSPTLPRYVGTRDPYPTYPNQTRSFDHATVIGPGFKHVPHRLVTAITLGYYVDLAAFSLPRRRNHRFRL